MFDLNTAILEWRRRMVGGGVTQPEVLDELESHLREDVERQTRAGAVPEDAFELAAKRLGEAAMLKAEFKGSRSAAARLWTRVFLGTAGLAYICTVAYALLAHEMSSRERLLGYLALVVSAICGLGLWRAAAGYAGGERIRAMLGVTSAVAGGAWFVCFFMIVLPRCEFSISQLVVALLWGLTPVIASIGFAWGLGETGTRLPGRMSAADV